MERWREDPDSARLPRLTFHYNEGHTPTSRVVCVCRVQSRPREPFHPGTITSSYQSESQTSTALYQVTWE